ncbi:MAG: tRNA (adenosine(37)-N6)-threonylcarbamoyltransferase complex ATPase subunit type 1 TsaE [Eubacterium sp.]|nr:tRNA (adenosine(37)-N6)-threonylcarbamoyltransferase complex ATPase subunit type 1 TsaE [Eubacterium sp.]MBR6172783.1 tRNA (adenosine(37)-N6)-threonylcarbamoyltransferase complex ATPase subunit type 1 TsaE [Eubacterium sp.]
MERETYSPRETFELAKSLAEQAKGGEVYCLDGDLGVGKTVFAQGFGAGLGITEPIASPTFTILKEYHEGRLTLYHFDVYRIGSEDEMEEIGFYDLAGSPGSVTLIEWSKLIEGILPKDRTVVTIEKDPEKGFDYRLIRIG